MKVLIIEDEQELVTSISTYLTQQGFVCDSALDFDHADLLINLYKYDCIVVDITLPDGSGLEIIKQLKEIRSSAGIIIVSA
ncbi:MAG: response regulator, partial [Calditrichaeota bacterium]|nr:response regulator [Calditrichota bacterium]